jgi:hypothetical protein
MSWKNFIREYSTEYVCHINVVIILHMRVYKQMWILLLLDNKYICHMNVLYDENIQPNVDIISSGR